MMLPLHSEVLRTGWIGDHLFMPGISTSECGAKTARDDTTRHATPPATACKRCLKVVARTNRALRDADMPDTYGQSDIATNNGDGDDERVYQEECNHCGDPERVNLEIEDVDCDAHGDALCPECKGHRDVTSQAVRQRSAGSRS